MKDKILDSIDKMKVLFVSKPLFMEPLGLMYLSSAAKKNGHETRLAYTSENLDKIMSEYRPDVVGYSVMTGDDKMYAEVNQKLKDSHEFFSIFGGPHPTFFPKYIKEKGIDAICRGEGEETFVEVLNNIQNNKDISEVRNLAIKYGEGVKENPLRNLSEIDSLAFPDRELIKDRTPSIDGPIKHFLASRGCPFSCTYCFNDKFSALYSGKGKKVRFRNVENLIDEISEVVNTSPTRIVYFQDDTFTLNKNWLKDFSEAYKEKINMPFHCHVRPNTVDEDKINLLKEAGCYSVHIAAETAEDNLRNNILKRGMSKEQIYQASDLLRSKDIKFMLQNIIGIPGGTIENDIETLEMNIRCKPDYAWVSIFQPYPGTALGDYSKEHGYYTGDFQDLGNNFFDSSKLNFS